MTAVGEAPYGACPSCTSDCFSSRQWLRSLCVSVLSEGDGGLAAPGLTSAHLCTYSAVPHLTPPRCVVLESSEGLPLSWKELACHHHQALMGRTGEQQLLPFLFLSSQQLIPLPTLSSQC